MKEIKILTLKNIIKKSFLILFPLLALIPWLGTSQKWEYGGGVGLMHYKGDISPRFRPLDGRPGANLFVRYNRDRAISYRASIDAGRIQANETRSRDRFQKLRGYAFNANIVDLNGRVEYNFHNFRVSQARNVSNWTPYAYIGLGATYRKLNLFSVKVTNGSTPMGINYNNKFMMSVPYGVGFKKKWKGPWNFGAEFGSHKLMSLSIPKDSKNKRKDFLRYDYLDGVGIEVDNPSDRLQTGNKDLGDWHFYTNFYISYVFYKVACPKD